MPMLVFFSPPKKPIQCQDCPHRGSNKLASHRNGSGIHARARRWTPPASAPAHHRRDQHEQGRRGRWNWSSASLRVCARPDHPPTGRLPTPSNPPALAILLRGSQSLVIGHKAIRSKPALPLVMPESGQSDSGHFRPFRPPAREASARLSPYAVGRGASAPVPKQSELTSSHENSCGAGRRRQCRIASRTGGSGRPR